jgi:hypothetical protein
MSGVRLRKLNKHALVLISQGPFHNFDQLQPALPSAPEGEALPACNQQKE